MTGLMRKQRIFSKVLIGVCVLAVTALYADLQTGYYAPENLGSLWQSSPRVQQPSAVYSVAAYPLYPANLAPGEGRQDVEAYCNTCHSPRYIPMQPLLPAATWEAEVSKMQKVFGMDIPADSQARILKYLETHYTPETRKR